jgi:hypothetical protein
MTHNKYILNILRSYFAGFKDTSSIKKRVVEIMSIETKGSKEKKSESQ